MRYNLILNGVIYGDIRSDKIYWSNSILGSALTCLICHAKFKQTRQAIIELIITNLLVIIFIDVLKYFFQELLARVVIHVLFENIL